MGCGIWDTMKVLGKTYINFKTSLQILMHKFKNIPASLNRVRGVQPFPDDFHYHICRFLGSRIVDDNDRDQDPMSTSMNPEDQCHDPDSLGGQ